MNKKVALVSVLLFVLILAVVAVGCSNVLLKSHQSNPSIRVQLEKSSGARNATTGDYQITAWIENRDGTESHHQEINATAGADASITFEELVIGSQINIHLELIENNDTQKKFTGTSSWTIVNEGTNVIVIALKEASDTGEMDGPVSGDDPEDEGDPVLTRIEAQYTGTYQLVGNAISLNNISITQHFDDGSSLSVNGNDSNYTVVFDSGVNSNTAIGDVPATVTHKTNPQITADFTIPVKYELDASNLTISGNTSVEQNGNLQLTASYLVTYQIYDTEGNSTSYKVEDYVTLSWSQDAIGDSWQGTAVTTTTGAKTATIKLTPKDEWCVTTGGIEQSRSFTVNAVTASIGDIVYSDGTISTSLESGKTPVGIVIKTTNSQPSLILALNDGSNTELTYSKAETACASYGTTCGDGKTWRIPTANEWKNNIYANKTTIQSALTTAGGSQMGTGYYYWTSDNYQRIILSSGVLNTADRTDPENATTTHARFVRDWQ